MPVFHTAQGALAAFNRAAFRVCQVITGALLAALVVTNMAEMTSRGFWGTSIQWVFETNTLMADWLYFLGIFLVYFRRSDISVDLVVRKLPAPLRRTVDVLVDVAIVGTCLLIGWEAVKLVTVQWPFKSPGLRIPNPLFTAPVLIGAVLMCATMFERLVGRFADAESVQPFGSQVQES
jgi:TRAP-type C4-dicarboxylate transport system permease small subunit